MRFFAVSALLVAFTCLPVVAAATEYLGGIPLEPGMTRPEIEERLPKGWQLTEIAPGNLLLKGSNGDDIGTLLLHRQRLVAYTKNWGNYPAGALELSTVLLDLLKREIDATGNEATIELQEGRDPGSTHRVLTISFRDGRKIYLTTESGRNTSNVASVSEYVRLYQDQSGADQRR